jgi:hypothetical protein
MNALDHRTIPTKR